MFEKLTDPRDVILHEGRIPVRHRYTPGVAGEPFFVALKEDGRILGSRCPECGIVYCPPRLFCERDFSHMEPGETVGPGGVLESFTIGFAGIEGEPLDEPVTLGLIRLDGAGTLLVHFLVDAEEMEIGMRVEAALLPEGERKGSILDLRGFRPA